MFFCATFLLALCGFLPPQKPNKSNVPEKPLTKVHLKSGASFEGKIRSEDEKFMRLEVSFGEVLLNKEEIDSINRGIAMQVISEEAPAETKPEVKPKPKPVLGFKPLPALPKESKTVHVEESPEVVSAGPSVSSDAKIEGILTHYLWFLPETGNSRILLGAGFFMAFFGLFFFASKLAGIETISFGQALGFCGLMFTLFILQLHFDSTRMSVTTGYVILDFIACCLLVRFVLKEPFYRGAAVFAFFVFTALLGVLGSELGYVLTHAPQA